MGITEAVRRVLGSAAIAALVVLGSGSAWGLAHTDEAVSKPNGAVQVWNWLVDVRPSGPVMEGFDDSVKIAGQALLHVVDVRPSGPVMGGLDDTEEVA